MASGAQINSDILYLDSDTSIVLPYFDTSSIVNSNIQAITLSLYVLNKTPNEPSRVQITINPIDLNSNLVGDGLSSFINVNKDSYIDFRLPKELFERSIQTPKRFLVRLFTKDQRLVLKEPDSAGTVLDPRLVVEHSELLKNESLDTPNIIENNYYNITNSKLTFVEGNNTEIANNSNSDIAVNNNKDGLPWWVVYIILPIVVGLILAFLIYKFGWNQ